MSIVLMTVIALRPSTRAKGAVDALTRCGHPIGAVTGSRLLLLTASLAPARTPQAPSNPPASANTDRRDQTPSTSLLFTSLRPTCRTPPPPPNCLSTKPPGWSKLANYKLDHTRI